MHKPQYKQWQWTPLLYDAKRLALIAVLISVVLNATGQIMFKAARIEQESAPLFSLFLQLETWVGLLLYGLSSILWLWVLARAQLSYAYPLLALTFPIVVALSVIVFGESVSPLRWLGVAIIITGVSLLART